jgi:ribosomal-protein-alanine N-acetyltransferase
MKMAAPELISDRLIYKPLSLAHLSNDYVDWMNDKEVIKYLESGGDYTIEKLENFLKEVEEKAILFWAIHIKQTGKHIGNIKIDPVNSKNRLGEYGIMMGDRSEWGKGYAKEASLTIIHHCFQQLKLRKITLGVVENNKSAVDLYKAINFEIEGVYKKHGFYNGVLCNVLRMALFNAEAT